MSAETLAITPSRLTAEAMLHEARERRLTETARRGFVSGYEGIRISATGRRFRILDVTIWNVNDASGRAIGQAATFARWSVSVEPAGLARASVAVSRPCAAEAPRRLTSPRVGRWRVRHDHQTLRHLRPAPRGFGSNAFSRSRAAATTRFF